MMSDKFQNKYRIESTRLKHWDYGWNASYFVTICTNNRICFFGDVVNGEMVLNDIGRIAHDCWLHIPEHFPFVKLGNHIVMPNHVHGVLVIDKPDNERNVVVEARLIAPLPPPPDGIKKPGGITGDHNPMLHDNLSKIVRWYKGRTTFESRKLHADFAWQPRFHDHIIRDEKSFDRISDYIINNPMNWSEDSLKP